MQSILTQEEKEKNGLRNKEMKEIIFLEAKIRIMPTRRRNEL